MKYIWEKKDIQDAWGRYVMLDVSKAADDYMNLPHMFKIGGDGCSPTLTCMGDGLVMKFESTEKLLEHLNNNKIGYRPVRRGELLEAIKHNWHRHESINRSSY